MHSAHGCTHHQPQVVHSQALGEQAVLQLDHVVVLVAGKTQAQAVAGLAGFTVAHVVRQDDEVFCGVEQLAGTEKHAGEGGSEELAAETIGAVKDQDSVVHLSTCVLLRRTQSPIVQLEFRQSFARLEWKVFDDKISRPGRGIVAWPGHRISRRKAHHEYSVADFCDASMHEIILRSRNSNI